MEYSYKKLNVNIPPNWSRNSAGTTKWTFCSENKKKI